MPRRPRHFLWDAYLAKAGEGGMTEAEARKRLKDFFPNVAHMVDAVVVARGDDSKLSDALRAQTEAMLENEESALASSDMAGIIRDRLGRKYRGNYQRDEQGRFASQDSRNGRQNGSGEEGDLDMNQAIRASISGRRQPLPEG